MILGISNDDFLRALFRDQAANAHVCGFVGVPGGPEAAWAGDKWRGFKPDKRAALASQNAYFAISTFRDDAVGKARRNKSLLIATYAIVIDDVGTKVIDTSKLLAPSWVLETSPGNFQWGYILSTPEPDAGRIDALLDGVIAKRLSIDGSDPGMKGVTRYVRLPQGRNTKSKYGPTGFSCRLIEWCPNRVYTLQELAEPWDIALPALGASPQTPQRGAIDPTDDPVFNLLESWGMVPGTRTADGGYHITCPFAEEHTDAAETGAAYWLGGGFKCHHGHCIAKGRGDVRRYVDERLKGDGRPSLAGADFEHAGKPLTNAVWIKLVKGQRLSLRDIRSLAFAAEPAVTELLDATHELLSADVRSIRRRICWAREKPLRQAREHRKNKIRPTRVPLPVNAPKQVTMAEAHAALNQALAVFGPRAEYAP